MKTILFLFTQLFFISTSFSEIKANYNIDRVEISWDNPKHIEVDYFVIERSRNGGKFKEILKIKATNNLGDFIEYYEIDYKPLNKKAFYRIKQVDIDGHTYYSEMVAVYNFKKIKSLSKLFPSSKKNKNLKSYDEKNILVVLFNENQEQFIVIVDLVMINKHIRITKSSEFLPTGDYIIIATSDDRVYGKKIIANINYSKPVYTQNTK
ncbi:MAG: hypothetical protein JKX68_05675 [Flavobacteriales bacterium]|nr:hypothetical protein [Flavobacteriales bacterium]